LFKNLNRSTYIINANSLQNYEGKREEKYLEFWPENWQISSYYWWGIKGKATASLTWDISPTIRKIGGGEARTTRMFPGTCRSPWEQRCCSLFAAPVLSFDLHPITSVKNLFQLNLANLNSYVMRKKTKVHMSSGFLLHPWSWNPFFFSLVIGCHFPKKTQMSSFAFVRLKDKSGMACSTTSETHNNSLNNCLTRQHLLKPNTTHDRESGPVSGETFW
jgi:hypothetical protein